MADLTLATLRRQLAEQKRVDDNVHNLAKAMFQPGTKIEYHLYGERRYFGESVSIAGYPGRTQLRVKNLATGKQRNIHIEQITGLLQEN